MRTAEQAQAIAKKVMASKFSTAQVAFCAGSIIRGEGTETSDIDLVVVFPELKQAWRESFVFDGWPIEAFVHDPATLNYFFDEIDGKSGVPSLPQMVVEGLVVWGSEDYARPFKNAAQKLLRAGPALLSADEIRNRIYGITDLLDDLKAPKSRDEAIGIGVRLYDTLGDFILRSERCWSGDGKQISRALQRQLPARHTQFINSFEALFSKNETAPLIKLTEDILKAHGGPIFDGYRREAPAEWRSKLNTSNKPTKCNTILYVRDQKRATMFYKTVLCMSPTLDVPGMTEFQISKDHVLGLMPEAGIKRLLGDRLPDPVSERTVPRAEIYLTVEDPERHHVLALENGANELSPFEKRNWGDFAAYSLDLDGHVLVFARSEASI